MPKLTPGQARSLSPDEIQRHNDARPPSNRVLRDDERCPAQVRDPESPRFGEQCTRSLGAGTSHPGIGHCSKHGGSTPAGRKAAARAYGRQLILDHKERFGGDRHDPLINNITAESALVEELRRSVAMVRWLESRISMWQSPDSSLEDGSEGLGLPQLVEETTKGAPGMTDTQAWLLLYREERKHAAQIAKMCIDAKISARLVSLAEAQGNVISRIVSGVLKELKLSAVQAELVPAVVPGIIRRANMEFINRTRPDDALEEVNSLPALPTGYKTGGAYDVSSLPRS